MFLVSKGEFKMISENYLPATTQMGLDGFKFSAVKIGKGMNDTYNLPSKDL